MKRNTDTEWKKKHVKLHSFKNKPFFLNWYLNLLKQAMKTCFPKTFLKILSKWEKILQHKQSIIKN